MTGTGVAGLGVGPNVGDVLRMSVLNALLAIQSYRADHPETAPEAAAKVLVAGPLPAAGFAYQLALEVAAQDAACVAPGEGERTQRVRALVERLIIRLTPPWAWLIPKGRGFLATYLEPAARQCLDAAGMYDREPSDEALACWDRLSALFRAEADAGRTATGRLGERLSIEHEARCLTAAGRPDLIPHWVALDDNTLGYDVRSFEVTFAGVAPRYIEVKATEASPPRFFLSRAEWDMATQLSPRYVFHIWHLPNARLTQVAVDAVAAHIPEDRGHGRWHRVEVTLRDGQSLQVVPLLSADPRRD